jgi:hypothetical protein
LFECTYELPTDLTVAVTCKEQINGMTKVTTKKYKLSDATALSKTEDDDSNEVDDFEQLIKSKEAFDEVSVVFL